MNKASSGIDFTKFGQPRSALTSQLEGRQSSELKTDAYVLVNILKADFYCVQVTYAVNRHNINFT